jgi:hypothetical protein
MAAVVVNADPPTALGSPATSTPVAARRLNILLNTPFHHHLVSSPPHAKGRPRVHVYSQRSGNPFPVCHNGQGGAPRPASSVAARHHELEFHVRGKRPPLTTVMNAGPGGAC